MLIHVILTRIPGLLHNVSGQPSSRVPAKLSVKRHSPLHFLCFSIFINNFADDCTSGYHIENELYTICIFSSMIKPHTALFYNIAKYRVHNPCLYRSYGHMILRREPSEHN